jgi:AcrR family transcriptional regulator
MDAQADDGKTARDNTRQDILAVAYEEFVERGLDGARVDQIAARTATAKRMIYYYFGSKEGLFLAVLERAYAGIREAERELGLEPREAIARFVAFTFYYHETNPGFSRLVSIENIHKGADMAKSQPTTGVNRNVIEIVRAILEKGRSESVFRDDRDPVDVHMLISSFCFFRVANRYTFGQLFDRDFSDGALKLQHKQLITDVVVRALALV